MDLKKIDPSLGLMKEFARITNGVTAQVNQMRDRHIFTDGKVVAKHKTLGAMLWSISARCEPCIKFYVAKAKQLGATEAEIGEYLAVASTMGGCVGEMWALKAYQGFVEANDTKGVIAEPSCCR